MQILTDLSEITSGLSIAPVVLAASNQGASVDLGNDNIATQAYLAFSAATQAMTGVTYQVEEWNGTTASGSTWAAIPNMSGVVTTSPTGGTVVSVGPGLRTQRYARMNVLTFSSGNVGAAAIILAMPKSSGGTAATGYSRSPSS